MPLRLNVGHSKKVGLPSYGSVGASCNVEVELDSSLLQSDMETFQGHVRRAYTACAQAVNDELSRALRQAENSTPEPGANGPSQNGFSSPKSPSNGSSARQARRATQSQVRALLAMAERRGLNLGRLTVDRFGAQRIEDLSITDASSLIDELKATAQNGAKR